MLRIDCPSLPPDLQAYLDNRCAQNSSWNSLSGSVAADQIKTYLSAAFHHKCGYCEKIEASTVDHFWPQSNDPSKRWQWNNFILACDECQRSKHAQLPIDAEGRWMVNPRVDEPLEFLYFDYVTGIVVPLPTSEETLARGRVTVERLGFDHRSMLNEERRCKLWDVLGYMVRIADPQSESDAQDAWQQLSYHLRPEAPYLGMIRQMILKPGEYAPIIEALRAQRPEFDDLIAEWCLPLETI